MTGGRCHGPDCTRDARDGFFCSEEHQVAWHRQFWNRAEPPSEQAIRCIMDAAPVLPAGLAELMAVDPDPHPQPGELWRVGRREALLVWVRKILPDVIADVIAVTMEVEMADTTSLLVSATSTPFQTPLAVLTVVRTHLPWSVFLSRICVLDIARDVEEVIRADRAGRLPTGCWVGPPLIYDDDQRIAFRQELMALLASWAPSQDEDSPPRPEPHPPQADLNAALAVAATGGFIGSPQDPADDRIPAVLSEGGCPAFWRGDHSGNHPEDQDVAGASPATVTLLGAGIFGNREYAGPGYFPSANAAFPQVAPPNPQVGFLGRAFHWLFGRTS